MSSLYSRNKDLSSRTRKSVLDSPPSSPSPSTKSLRHERISRSDSGGVECSDRLNQTKPELYARRDRLASINKTDDDSLRRNYKKLYEDALAENEKLKARLEDSKQELTKIRLQLDSVTQKQDRISESGVLESEKRERQTLEKRVSDMEEELKKPAAVRFRCGYQP